MSERRLKFGVFLPPMHRVGTNPTLNLERSLQLVERLEGFGYDEVWIGEHHSGGVETIASPEVFIAAASQRTSRIKLGTGVNSLPYHQPLVLADRLLMLDHLTRGRLLAGFGPGQLVPDALMMGIDPARMRPMMEESLSAIMRLLRGETVTQQTDWFSLVDAKLHLAPYSAPLFDTVVAATVSPAGPTAAGRAGTSLLSVGATTEPGFAVLDQHWEILSAEAAQHGHVPDRGQWRMMGPMFLAETESEALEASRYGWKWMFNYLSHNVPTSFDPALTHDEIVAAANRSGSAVVGTPQMAIEQIQRLVDKSGGFGSFLLMGADFARYDDMLRSYELFAEFVMPHFQGQLAAPQASYDEAVGRADQLVAEASRAQAMAKAQFAAGG